jgi:hypothetical protein
MVVLHSPNFTFNSGSDGQPRASLEGLILQSNPSGPSRRPSPRQFWFVDIFTLADGDFISRDFTETDGVRLWQRGRSKRCVCPFSLTICPHGREWPWW